jgi:tRNA threonylcarbamoyl adenosine modification protein YeaZ
MLLLALDTAGPSCAVALARSRAGSPEVLIRIEERIGRGHAESLMPMIRTALGKAGASFADLQRIAVATGPGSFTGVRVGVAAARGLALALDIPAVGVGSLAALAYAAAKTEREGTVAAMLDAKRGEVYVFAADIRTGTVLVEAAAVRVEDLATLLRNMARPLVLTGAAAMIVANALHDAEARTFLLAESPDIADVAALGLATEPVAPPAPIYVRPADAKPQSTQILLRS